MSIAKKIHLRPEEEIVEVIRRYPLTHFWNYLLGVIFLFGSAFSMFWLFAQGWWGYTLFGLGIVLGLFIIFKTWFFGNKNVLIITTERVVDIGRIGWFDEMISSVGLLDIKDIFITRKGLLSTVFNYGNLVVVTKNEHIMLEAGSVHEPQKWQGAVLQIMEEYRNKRKFGDRQAIYSGFKKIISELSEAEMLDIRERINVQLDSIITNEVEIFEEDDND